MGYKFYRNSLIKIGLIAWCLPLIFYDIFVNGKNLGDVRALVLVTIATAAMILWLAFKMYQTKNVPPPKPAPTSRHKRQRERTVVSIGTCIAGIVFIVLGINGWMWKVIPLHFLGGFILLIGAAALAGINVWIGGPLDPIHDPDE